MLAVRDVIETYMDDEENTKKTRNRQIVELADKLHDNFASEQDVSDEVPSRKVTKADVRIFGSDNPYTLTAMINPKNLYRKAYLGLNGVYGVISADGMKISWTILDVTTQAGVQVRNKYKNVVEIKMLTSLATLVVPASRPIVNPMYANIVQPATTITNVLIDELVGDSFIDSNTKRRFHFIAEDDSVSDVSVYRKLVVDNSCHQGVYTFGAPISILSDITMSFARLDRVLQITTQDPDDPMFIGLEVTYINEELVGQDD
jgi:hypothetical protein